MPMAPDVDPGPDARDSDLAPGISRLPPRSTSRLLRGRFERTFPLPVVIVGGLLGAMVLGAGMVGRGMRRGGWTFEQSATVAAWTVGATVLVVIVMIAGIALFTRLAVNRVRALRPGLGVFASWRTTDARLALLELGWRGRVPSTVVVAHGPAGLEFWPDSIAEEPQVVVEWSAVVALDAGESSDTVLGRTSWYPAILLAIRHGAEVLVLPVNLVDYRNPTLRSYAGLNRLIEDLRGAWEAAQREARSQRAASGGSVSSTDAGRPAQGSSDATTEP